MKDVLTADQMRRTERCAIESGEVTGLELMERAGQGVVAAIFEEWPELSAPDHRAVVLCGPGNNGGDGYVVARLLHDRGWQVGVVQFGDPDKLPPDARTNFDRLTPAGVSLADAEGFLTPLPDILVDAVFGIGMTRAASGPLRDVLDEIADARMPLEVVAIDVPTGLHADTGEVLECALKADLTVTFHSRKPGHVLGNGPDICGKVVVRDIGL